MVYEEHHREEEILARYLTGRVDRREFLRRVALIGGGSALALTFAGALSCAPSATPTPTIAPKLPPGPGEMVAPSDSRIEAGPVEFQSGEEQTRSAPTTTAYTSFLLKVAHQGSFAELVASLLPCQWGYWEIGRHLSQRGQPESAPLYCQWIQMYDSTEFGELAQQIRELANRLAEQSGSQEVAAMAEAYLTSLRFEHQFWDMAFNLEEWPV